MKYTQVNENILTGTHIPTKREMLRILMSIFDPLGLLANFLVYAKILIQETWRQNIDWDEPITDALQVKWIQWITVLKDVEEIQIPRLYSTKLSPGTPNSIQLQVAPNKPMSIPRVELQAAVLGTRLSGSIKSSQRLEIEKNHLLVRLTKRNGMDQFGNTSISSIRCISHRRNSGINRLKRVEMGSIGT